MLRKFLPTFLAVSLLFCEANALAVESQKPTVEFTRLLEKLPAGAEWLTIEEGTFFCQPLSTAKADGVLKPADMKIFYPIFSREFKNPAFRANMPGVNLFENSADKDVEVDYEIGGLVIGMNINICQGMINYSATSKLETEWQIYSNSEKKVVETITTSGSLKRNLRTDDIESEIALLIQDAFASNVIELSKSPQLMALLNKPVERIWSTEMRSGTPRLSATAAPLLDRPLGEVPGAVVVVVTGSGHGSGVLISVEGLVLTNQHVVGTATQVTIRWSDGFETQGEVLRTHKGRDVALIKTDGRGRSPLPVRQAGSQSGETVLAVGAPLEEELQGTLTRGVSSGTRILDNYAFIQSDVMVNPGNSGGPLIDEKGFVVGLTDIGFRPDGVPVGLNFFIPIKDALDFLAVDLAIPPAPPKATPASTPRPPPAPAPARSQASTR